MLEEFQKIWEIDTNLMEEIHEDSDEDFPSNLLQTLLFKQPNVTYYSGKNQGNKCQSLTQLKVGGLRLMVPERLMVVCIPNQNRSGRRLGGLSGIIGIIMELAESDGACT